MTNVTESELAEGTADGSGQAKGRRLLLIVSAVIVALVAAGGAGWFFLTATPNVATAPTSDVHEPHFYDLPLMTVNLNTGGGAPEFLRVSIALEVRDPAMIAMIEPRLPRVLDTFQVYLRELRRSDLEGSAGVYRLKEELHRRINLAVYPAAVDNVLFKELLVQ